MTISKTIEKALVDLTGQLQPEMALQSVMADIVEHRLEKVNAELIKYEKKYNSSFVEFKKAWGKNKIADKYGYETEKDYWEWEALYSRKLKIQRIARWAV